jgi:hypothetical protein
VSEWEAEPKEGWFYHPFSRLQHYLYERGERALCGQVAITWDIARSADAVALNRCAACRKALAKRGGATP